MDERLILTEGESGTDGRFPLPRDGAVVVGRRKQCDIFLDDPSISGKHCRIEGAEGEWRIQDLGSTNGVFVNGQRTTEATLSDGDALRLGTVKLQFALAAPEANAPQPVGPGEPPPDAPGVPTEPAMGPEESPDTGNEAQAQEAVPPVRSLPKLWRPRPLRRPLGLCALVLALGVLGWFLSQQHNGGTGDKPDTATTTSQQLDNENAPDASGQDPALPPQDTAVAPAAGAPDVAPIDQDTYVLAQPAEPGPEPLGAVRAFSPDCRLALILPAEGDLRVRELGQPARTVAFAGCRSGMAIFSPSGERVAAASPDAKVQIWSTSTGKELQTWQRQEGRAFQMFFSQDGTFLVTVARSSVAIWNTRTGEEARLFDPSTVQGMPMALSATGQKILLNRKNTFVIRDLSTQEEQAYTPPSESNPNGNATVIGPDFSVVAQAGSRLRIMRIAEQSHTTSESFLGDRPELASAMDLSPDGAYLLIGSEARSGGSEGGVVAWNIEERRPCWSFRGGKSRSGMVTAVAFSPDMKRILAAYQNGKIRIWERISAAPQALVPAAKKKL